MPRFVDVSGPVTAAAEVKAAINADVVIDVKDHGAVGDGVEDDTTALQDAIDATPDGGTLLIRAGRYKVTSALESAAQSIHIVANNATLVQAGDFNVLSIEGEWESNFDVSSLSASTVTEGTVSGPSTVLTLSSAPSWYPGDVVKLFADDVIDYARPSGSATLKDRVGQFFVVYSVSGTTVTLIGTTRESFTTNIRVARMVKHTTTIRGLRIESDDIGSTGSYRTGRGLAVRFMYAPNVDVSFGPMPSQMSNFRSCYMPQATVVADRANTRADLDPQQLGYVLLDSGSEYGRYRILSSTGRHAYTDDTAGLIAADTTDPYRYGGSYGHVIEGQAHGYVGVAISTHSTSRGHTFSNWVVSGCGGAFGLRGIEHRLINCTVEDCDQAVSFYDDGSTATEDSQSYGHEVNGLVIRRSATTSSAGSVISIASNASTAVAPFQGVVETRPTVLRNITVSGVQTNIVQIINTTVLIENMHVYAPGTVTGSTSILRPMNSDVTVRNLTADYRGNTTGTSLRPLGQDITPAYGGTSSVIRGDNLIFLFNSEAVSRILALTVSLSGDVTELYLSNIQVSYAIPMISAASPAAGSTIDYRALDDYGSSFYLSASNSAIASTDTVDAISRSQHDVVLRCAPSDGARTLAKLLPGAVRGQKLTVFNDSNSGNAVTVGSGSATYLTDNINNLDVVLGRDGQSATWMWDGSVWQQLAEPGRVAAPAATGSAGTPGEWAVDSSYFYVCTATDTWKRAAISTW